MGRPQPATRLQMPTARHRCEGLCLVPLDDAVPYIGPVGTQSQGPAGRGRVAAALTFVGGLLLSLAVTLAVNWDWGRAGGPLLLAAAATFLLWLATRFWRGYRGR